MKARRDLTGLWCVAVFALALGWGYLRPAATQPKAPAATAAGAVAWDPDASPGPEMRRLFQHMVMN